MMRGMRLSIALNSPLDKRDSPVAVARSFSDSYNQTDLTKSLLSLVSILLRLSPRLNNSVSLTLPVNSECRSFITESFSMPTDNYCCTIICYADGTAFDLMTSWSDADSLADSITECYCCI